MTLVGTAALLPISRMRSPLSARNPIFVDPASGYTGTWAVFAIVFAMIGSFAFGGVLGWITADAVSRSKTFGVAQLGGVVSTVVGAAVTSVFANVLMFSAYCVGLALGYTFHVALYQFDEDGNLKRKPQSPRSAKTP